MRKLVVGIVAATLAVGCVEMNPGAKDAAGARTLEVTKKWFKKAQFGMMAHWGLYTLLGGEWKGKHPYGEWIMHGNRIPLKEYAALAKAFNPVLFDPIEEIAEACAGRETCERLAALFRELKPRALILHWPLDTHLDHVMSTAAALNAIRLADIKPEIYFHEQDIQSRGFPPAYWIDVTKQSDRIQEIVSLYKCQDGPAIAARKKRTEETNALRIRTEWDESARYEIFAIFPGTIPAGKGIFDSMEGVLR